MQGYLTGLGPPEFCAKVRYEVNRGDVILSVICFPARAFAGFRPVHDLWSFGAAAAHVMLSDFLQTYLLQQRDALLVEHRIIRGGVEQV
jgi:hypothetical protein